MVLQQKFVFAELFACLFSTQVYKDHQEAFLAALQSSSEIRALNGWCTQLHLQQLKKYNFQYCEVDCCYSEYEVRTGGYFSQIQCLAFFLCLHISFFVLNLDLLNTLQERPWMISGHSFTGWSTIFPRPLTAQETTEKKRASQHSTKTLVMQPMCNEM